MNLQENNNIANAHIIYLSKVKPSKFNPRKTFRDADLTELAESIKAQGVLQPIMVRPQGSNYEIVYGERRYHAALLAGLTIIPDWTEGLTLPVGGCSLSGSLTKAKPLHTEASLLGSMETCGKDLVDEELKAQLKDCGIGTPATRASIIETLFTREYMVRSKKSLVPTEKGLAIYSIVKDMKIADVEMTGQWEAALAKIEKGEMKDDTFHKGIEVYATQITSELLASKILYTGSGQEVDCPKCGSGKMSFFSKVVKCNNSGCELPIFRTLAGKQLSDAQITELITNRKTGIIKGFQSKAGKSFDASLTFDESYKVVFVFPEKKKRK